MFPAYSEEDYFLPDGFLPPPLMSRQGLAPPIGDFNAPVEGIAGVPYDSIYLAIGKTLVNPTLL